MTTVMSTATELAATAAASVAVNLASAEPLTVGEPTRDAAVAEGAAHALLAQFTGSATGDLVLLVDDDLASALRESSIGPLELTAALAPTIEAISLALGSVVLGPLQEVDPRLAINRALQHQDSVIMPLRGTQSVRASVALGVEPQPVPQDVTPAAAGSVTDGPVAERLDLLRSVEMEATAELGRARMTVNDLLSLRSGAVIELDRAAGAPADLYVNGRLIARGEVVVVDENYGLRITQVVTDEATR
ncbi:MAG TPA: flagellar motor switch protein FliN [Jatrophihabitantaceae bacterium]|nr:flagellar motor switch protein FliN [Jatrophihabitantaceae bacterium]